MTEQPPDGGPDDHAHPFPWRLTAVIVAMVALASVLAGVILGRNSVDQGPTQPASVFTPAPDLLPIEKQRQVTLLVQIRDQERQAVSNVLLGVGGDTGFVAELILPRNLLLPTVPPVQLKNVDGPTGPVSPEGPLETLLGVHIDAAVEMDRLAWAGLLDSVGDHVDAGTAQRPDAFPLVIDRVLALLPPDDESVGQLLTSLGSMARTTVTNDDASHLMALVGTSLRVQRTQREVLPVTSLRAGSATADMIDWTSAAPLLQQLFPQAQLRPGHPGLTRVVLQRAGATLGVITSARVALAGAGFGVVDYHQTQPPGQASVVYVPADTDTARGHGRDVALLLGLPETAVVVDPAPDATVDVRVVLGSGARPV
jgi:hypothetical protein